MTMAPEETDPPDVAQLERLLRLATDQAGYRPAFYRTLLESRVFALTPPDSIVWSPNEEHLLRFIQWQRDDGALAIPFFSSRARRLESPRGSSSMILLPTRQLFVLTRGALLHLNPHSDFGREFVPAEVESLLTIGTVAEQAEEIIVTEGGVGIRAAPEMPTELIDALIVLFSQMHEVKIAYFGESYDVKADTPTSWLICIDVEGDTHRAIQATTTIVQDIRMRDRPVDILRLDTENRSIVARGIGTEGCFYDRSWGARLNDPNSFRTS